MNQRLTIGELARETGVKIVTIRYYEQTGVLPVVARSPGNYRLYDPEHARSLHFIRHCRDLGFSLEQIRQMLRLSSKDSPTCTEICAITAHHLKDIERKASHLKRLAAELRRINSTCDGNSRRTECRVIDALARG